jgi:lipopolysaccharide transport system ATP-binding protein
MQDRAAAASRDDAVIRVEGLGKKYRIRHQRRERYTALRDVISETVRSAFYRRHNADDPPDVEDFWALRNVTFDVRRGEVVGIIGRNGAGKSTLLKILSRITEPSEGRVELRGRVASLLEVGTGFHPELTGRENIFLNGAILGMARAEMARKFDEIVSFAGVEKFLDTPVKRYSSGMYVRMAFAVAAHLEPEILIVDEVLAVGDAEFQKKCLGKMNEVSRHDGRTVLFVSHNMPSIKAMCRNVILLNDGNVIFHGDAETGIARYLSSARYAPLEGSSRLVGRAMLIPDGLTGFDAYRIRLSFLLKGPLEDPLLGVGLNNDEGVRVATLYTDSSRDLRPVSAAGFLRGHLETEPIRLAPGAYSFKLSLMERGSEVAVVEHADELVVPTYSPFDRSPFWGSRGVVLVRHNVVLDDGESESA